jgi:hypothetical protein
MTKERWHEVIKERNMSNNEIAEDMWIDLNNHIKHGFFSEEEVLRLTCQIMLESKGVNTRILVE